jgi:hypothetical protein
MNQERNSSRATMKIIKPSLTSAAAGILGLALGCIIASRSALKTSSSASTASASTTNDLTPEETSNSRSAEELQ